MSSSTGFLLVLIVLCNLALLGSSRLTSLIRIVAAQGILLGLAPLAAHAGAWTARLMLLAAAAGALKGLVFPYLLERALRDANIRREVEPYVGFNLSLVAGVGALAVSFAVAARLPVPPGTFARLAMPVSFSAILTGLFVIVTRRKALSQALGYLVLENGIYLFGVSVGQEVPVVVELGVLLDVFVAVFVMGIAIFHIRREFDHLDVDRLSELRDWGP
ncbi:MAG: hydrogenase [Elusimicrobia bacterium]|nr:hydrogenase [Elusimicrobiota bacterium]